MTDLRSQRDAIGEAFVSLGGEFESLVVLSPDVGKSTGALKFNKLYPERYFCTGISEANTIGLASGLSAVGYISAVAGYAMFMAGKTWEQIRNSVCYPHTNVKIIATHGGINVGPDGVTHQAIEDIAIMRVIPNMSVLAPCDAEEVLPLMKLAFSTDGPFYMRTERSPLPNVSNSSENYRIGGSSVLREGHDVTVIAVGGMVYKSLLAADMLENEGISTRVINMYSIKPLDHATVIAAAKQTGCIITAEDHNKIGGLAGAVSEVVVRNFSVPMEFVAVEDTFAESGEASELHEKYHLTTDDIISAAKKGLARKS